MPAPGFPLMQLWSLSQKQKISNGNEIQASCFHADLFQNKSKNKLKVFTYKIIPYQKPCHVYTTVTILPRAPVKIIHLGLIKVLVLNKEVPCSDGDRTGRVRSLLED